VCSSDLLVMFMPCYVCYIMLCLYVGYVIFVVCLYVILCCVMLTVSSASARTLHATKPVSLIKTSDVHL
jgi:hypothetical protein